MIKYIKTLLLLALLININQCLELKSWMNNDIIKNKTLTQLTLPGTHDSGSYSCTDDIFDDPTKSIYRSLIKLADDLGLPVGDLILLWTKTQDKTFYEQLNGGIRYLDTRIAWGIQQLKWRTHHAIVLGGALQDLFDEVQRFLVEQPTEVVVLELSHYDGNPNAEQKQILIDMIQNTFKDLLLPRNYSLATTTVGQMIAMNKRLIVTLEDNDFIANNQNIWFNSNSETIENDYANSPDLATMEAHNVQQIDRVYNIQNKQKLYKSSWTLTPNEQTVIDMVLPWKPTNIKELADIANAALPTWFQQIQAKGYQYPLLGNIFIIDHFETSNVVQVCLSNIQPQASAELYYLEKKFLQATQ